MNSPTPTEDFANPLNVQIPNQNRTLTEFEIQNNESLHLKIDEYTLNKSISSSETALASTLDLIDLSVNKYKITSLLENENLDSILDHKIQILEEGKCPVENIELPAPLPIPTELLPQILPQGRFGIPKNLFKNYMLLWKSRLSLLIVFTTLASYCCSRDSTTISTTNSTELALSSGKKSSLLALCFGTFLQSGCANTLNELMEVERDRIMNRTKNRPLPTNSISMRHAAIQAAVVGSLGTFILGQYCNWNTALLGFLNIGIYAGIYTPLKTRHWINTWIGTIPGSIPSLMGTCAATGVILDPVGLFWFGLMTLWQIPHFMAISYKCRSEYEKAEYKMLPIEAPKQAALMSVVHSLALFPLCWSLPWIAPQFPWWFAIVSTPINWFHLLKPSLKFYEDLSKESQPGVSKNDLEKLHYDNATKLFWGSLKHLPILFSLSIIAFNWDSITKVSSSSLERITNAFSLNNITEKLSLNKIIQKLPLNNILEKISFGMISYGK